MKKVLFLCTDNYHHSRFSEYLFNGWAIQQGLNWRAESRGLAVDRLSNSIGVIAPKVVTGLINRGITLHDYIRQPLQVFEVDFKAANRVIAVEETTHRSLMATRHPGWVNSIEYWNVDDPDEDAIESSLDQLEQQIQHLLAELKTAQLSELPTETQALMFMD
ncbi:MAG: low molecular weight phosphatase family protein [Microcoleaceae cyanobacterium]